MVLGSGVLALEDTCEGVFLKFAFFYNSVYHF
jgi:hypothetical protein